MCVIMLSTHTRPSLATLRKGENRNRDGGGVAWIDTDEQGERWVYFEKNLDAEEIFAITEVVPFPFIVHFRISTAGGKSPYLCHPFPVSPAAPDILSGRSKRVLFHNGSITGWDDILTNFIVRNGIKTIPEGEWSDSRAAAFIAYHMGKYGENFLPIMSKSDRFIVLDANAPEGSEWRKWGDWYYCLKKEEDTPVSQIITSTTKKEYDGGMLFSNTRWHDTKTTTTGGSKKNSGYSYYHGWHDRN